MSMFTTLHDIVFSLVMIGLQMFIELNMVPLELENLEKLENWEDIFPLGKSQVILSRMKKSG